MNTPKLYYITTKVLGEIVNFTIHMSVANTSVVERSEAQNQEVITLVFTLVLNAATHAQRRGVKAKGSLTKVIK